MAWRNPRFGLLHAARLAGPGSVSSIHPVGEGSLDALLDDRAGWFVEMATSESDHAIRIDRGANGEAVDRLFIPEGHNLDGETIRVRASATANFTAGTTTLLASTVISGTGPISYDLTSSVVRYLELGFLSTCRPRLSELVFTRTRTTTTRGPRPNWTDDPIDKVRHLEASDGAVFHLVRGQDGRRMELYYEQVKDDDDRLVLEDLLAIGTARAFVLDPPYDDEPPRWCFLIDRQNRNENRVPTFEKRVSYGFAAELNLL